MNINEKGKTEDFEFLYDATTFLRIFAPCRSLSPLRSA